ncbi:MAG TPA: 4a-hydroxytetrahydrobiopterin dehydratase [Bryobacteraceae bacterium]|nr:4a-hydroxytetrahydrobiopterin dehydratase [Bryobacteraceae bacterium]
MPAALKGDALSAHHRHLPDWEIVEEHHIHRVFRFPDFQRALDFVNRVGALAEEAGHHPDVFLTWGRAEITIYTHSVNGLTEKDFALAGKINALHG